MDRRRVPKIFAAELELAFGEGDRMSEYAQYGPIQPVASPSLAPIEEVQRGSIANVGGTNIGLMNASGGYVLGRAVPEEVGGGSDRNESDRPVADDNAPGKVVSAPNTSGPSTEGVGRQASSVRMVPLGERAPLAAASLDDFMKPYETFQFCKLVDLKTYEDPRHPDDDAAASEVPKNQVRYVHFRLKTGKNPVSGFLETAFPEVLLG
jgi:hypothetical protein